MSGQLILGIDGGGTKTAFSLARLDQNENVEVVATIREGGSNILAVGREAAFKHLNSGLDLICAENGISTGQIVHSVIGLAGISSPEVRRLVGQWLQQMKLSNARLISDIDPVMMVGTKDNWGIALIVGTGTVAKGANSEGVNEVLGGWGYWYGDQASGYDLGRQTLKACVQSIDGIGAPTRLLDAVYHQLKISDAKEILNYFESRGDVRGEISKLSNLVPELAEQGDAVAQRILNSAIEYIVALCESLASRLSLGNDCPIALAGGVMCGNEFYRNSFKDALDKSTLTKARIKLVIDPVQGCLTIARNELLSR